MRRDALWLPLVLLGLALGFLVGLARLAHGQATQADTNGGVMAFAVDGTDCPPNQCAGGVDVSGNAEACEAPLLTPGAVTTNRLVKFSGTGGQATAQSTCTEAAGAIAGCSLTGNAATATA